MPLGHLSALVTIVIWGTTFISSKILLYAFTPLAILIGRFLIGYLALWCAYPKFCRPKNHKEELYFAAAGLCGITLYYLLENIALVYTSASHVGIIIAISPFFTAILDYQFGRHARPGQRFLAGFALSMLGIILIMNKPATGAVSLGGDLLALGAAIIWAIYSLLTEKIASFGYHPIQATRRAFFYGLLCMLPLSLVMGLDIPLATLKDPLYLSNLFFLGLGASALCFVTWNFAVSQLGPVKTSVYIYMVPAVTTASAVIILHETLTPLMIIGMTLTLIGLFLSESNHSV